MRTAVDFARPATLLRLAPGLLLLAFVLFAFRETAVAMVGIWIRSETFTHAFLVPPIVIWMVWRQREALAEVQARPAPSVLVPIVLVCLGWLLGELTGLNAVTQFALVMLLVLSVPAVFGIAVARALAFPLLFTFFAVPFGEFMVPTLMEWTANFTVSALQWSGVPVYREGLQFVIPSGSWSVIEACSGVRYLIASFMVGTLFAYLNFRSNRRRSVFIVFALLVPVIANWLRAYLIVMLGHLSGNRLAAGVDHIIYGWAFFGLVIGLMFWIGARFSETPAPIPPKAMGGERRGRDGVWVACAVATVLLGTQALYRHVGATIDTRIPLLQLAPSLGGDWAAAPEPLADWIPSFQQARATVARSYRNGGNAVAVWVGYYRNQGYDSKLITSSNDMTNPESDKTWARVSVGTHQLEAVGASLRVRTGNLRGSSEVGALNAPWLRVWQVYWIGGRYMTGDIAGRVQLAWDRLVGRGDDAAVVFFYSPMASADAVEAADAVLTRFVQSSLPAVTAALEGAKSGR